MCIETQKKDQFLIVTFLEKRLSAALLRMKALIQAGHQYILLDLSHVDFIDSSGLGAIVSSFKLLGNKGNFVLCGVHGAVMSLLNLTRMDRVFPIYASLEEAIRDAH
ncbi:MAG: anti-anti-sigma factor [Beggiatoa sp. IS2]|nr:MAG: anti-anti-sigma factor [Beggiatoa sp. IS2]